MIPQLRRIAHGILVAVFLSLAASSYANAGGPLKEKIQKRLSEGSNIQYQQSDDYDAPQASAPAAPEEGFRAGFESQDYSQTVDAELAGDKRERNLGLESRREVASFAIYRTDYQAEL